MFYSGLLLEGKMTDTLIGVARSGRPVHAVTELVDESLLLAPEEFAGHFDPHLWMNVAGWMQAVNAVTEALADFDPAASSGYAERATDYAATLTELHDYARRALGSIPEQQRILVTAVAVTGVSAVSICCGRCSNRWRGSSAPRPTAPPWRQASSAGPIWRCAAVGRGRS